MTTRPGFEDSVAELMHAEASWALEATDADVELLRLRARCREDAARNRRVVLVVAACVAAVAVAAGLVARPSADTPPPAKHPQQSRELGLDNMPAHRIVVRPVALRSSSAPVALRGLGRIAGIASEDGGRLWVLTSDPATQEWTLTRMAADRRTVEVSVRFAAAPSAWGSPWLTATDDAIVIALAEGGPLPAAAQFGDRHDGLLRLDRRSGRVLGFTPVASASTVEAAADGTVWALVAPDRLANIDPVTGRTLRTLKTPGLVDRALVQGNRIWVTHMLTSPMPAWQIDGRSGRVLHSATTAAQAIAASAGDAVVLAQRTGRVLRVDRGGAVSAVRLVLPGIGQVTDLLTDGHDLWLWVDTRTLVRLDGTTLTPGAAITLPWNGPYSLARDGADLLVSSPQQGTVRRVPASALTAPGS